jgi:acetate kinase
MRDGHVVLSLNSGSSSVKFALYRFQGDREERLLDGGAEPIGLAGGRLWARDSSGALVLDEPAASLSYRQVLDALFRKVPNAEAVGHRVVHGGPDHFKSELVTPDLMEQLKRLIPLARLHLPSQLAGMEFVHENQPDLPQVACFDTAFHRRMPEVAQRLPLPRKFWEDGVRKYGFHGLSYDYIRSALGADAKGSVIVAHLGNGASLAAMRDGNPVDTTMGLTPTGGVMMGTRTGDLDPGVPLYLMNEKGYNPAGLTHLMEEESGLLGVSGISSDMKDLLEASTNDGHAAQAVEMFCYQVKKAIGALAAALGGLDLLVFTGGIGERSAEIRRRICDGLQFLGIELDVTQNDGHASTLSQPGARCTVRMIPTNEDLMIARYTRGLCFGAI